MQSWYGSTAYIGNSMLLVHVYYSPITVAITFSFYSTKHTKLNCTPNISLKNIIIMTSYKYMYTQGNTNFILIITSLVSTFNVLNCHLKS